MTTMHFLASKLPCWFLTLRTTISILIVLSMFIQVRYYPTALSLSLLTGVTLRGCKIKCNVTDKYRLRSNYLGTELLRYYR